MRLEAVDKRVPQLVRVACVVEVKQHRLRVAFDGWPDRYSYWVDEDNPDIHPVGWCQKTGHPLEPPLSKYNKQTLSLNLITFLIYTLKIINIYKRYCSLCCLTCVLLPCLKFNQKLYCL